MTYIQDRKAIESAARLRAALEQLGTEVATKVGVKANRDAAKTLQARLIDAAPYRARSSTVKFWKVKSGETRSRDYGHLRDNIKVRRQTARKQGNIVFRVTTGNAFWGSFQEFGTINQPAYPWYRQTVEAAKGDLLAEQIIGLQTGIDKAARAAARRNRTVLANGRNG